MPNKNPPTELLELCERINKDYLASCDAKVEPWLMDEREWRLILTTKSGRVVTHLLAEKADGHTFRLFAHAIELARACGVTAGLGLAKKRIGQMVETAIDGRALPADRWGQLYLAKD